MQFDWWTFAFQLVNIAVLLWLLGRFLFRPVARIIAERKAETDRVMNEAEAAKKASKEAEEAARAERDRVAGERAELLEKARAEAEAQKKDMLAKAKTDAGEIVRKGKEAAKQALEDERAEEMRRAAKLSVAIAGRLMEGMPGDARIAGYAERLVEALGALDNQERVSILADGEDLRLVAPRELTKAELAAIRKIVGPALPHDGALPVEVDGTLIAGLELKGRHGVVHNSLAADLERVAEALDGEDADR